MDTKKIIIRFVVFFLLLSPAISFAQEQSDTPKTTENQNVVKKNSYTNDWEFYPGKLYLPADFLKGIKGAAAVRVKTPHLWRKTSGDLSSGKGYATYRTVIENLKPGELYAFQITKIQTAYKLFVNGKMLKSVGKVSENRETGSPKWSSVNALFYPEKTKAEVVLQVSNFYHKKGGIEQEILFEKGKKIISGFRIQNMLTLMDMGVLFIMAFLHFAYFFHRRQDRSNLYFSLLLLFSALFSMTMDKLLITYIFPNLNWAIIVKINYASNFLRLLFFALFFYLVLKKRLLPLFIKVFVAICLAMTLFIVIAPVRIFTAFPSLFLLLAMATLVIIYILIVEFKMFKEREPGIIFSVIGIVALLIAITNDILLEIGYIDTFRMLSFGIFIFVIFHSYFIFVVAARTSREIEESTKKMQLQGKVKNAVFVNNSYNFETPIRVISELIDADYAVIFVYKDDKWQILKTYDRESDRMTEINRGIFAGKGNELFSARCLNKAIESGKAVYIESSELNKIKDHAYLGKQDHIHGMLSYPLLQEDMVQAVLYFESHRNSPDFAQKSLFKMETVEEQLNLLLKTHHTYSGLNRQSRDFEELIRDFEEKIKQREEKISTLRSEVNNLNQETIKSIAKIEAQSNDIEAERKYARLMKQKLLPKNSVLQKTFPKHFMLNKPKRQVGGDFFMLEQISADEVLIIVADAPGIGVKGALSAIIAGDVLHSIIQEENILPKKILNEMQKNLQSKMQQVAGKKEDYYHMSVLTYNAGKKELVYAGAHTSIYLGTENAFTEFKSDREMIGEESNQEHFFSNRRIAVEKGDILYLTTNGLRKQIGGESGEIMGREAFKRLLENEVYGNPIEKQKEIIEQKWNDWRGNQEQSDDILIVGFEI